MPVLNIVAAFLFKAPFADVHWLTIPQSASAVQQAQWIWVQPPGAPQPSSSDAPTGTMHLRRVWQVTEEVRSAKVWFTADNLSSLRINGVQVGQSSRWDAMVQLDVTRYLRRGDNVVEAEVTNTANTGRLNPGGFIFAGDAETVGGRRQQIVSSEGWSSPEGAVVAIGAYSSEPWRLTPPDVRAPVFRKDIQVKPGVRSATARVIGLGHYHLYVNGRRQGRDVINQPWSQFDKTLYWKQFDVSGSLRAGVNTLGIELGNSFYRVANPPPGRHVKGDTKPDFSGGKPFLLGAEVTIQYKDGSSEQFVTDASWRWSPGPYALTHVYAGEDYDAALAITWKKPGFNDAGWQPPVVVPAPQAELRGMDWPGLEEAQSWKPVKILNQKPGVYSYVFPQNAMAILRFKARGKKGQQFRLKPSEVMTGAGEVQQLNLWGGEASCSYTLAGTATESHQWQFWYHGFQFVELTGAVPKGFPNPERLPVVEELEMVHVRTANAQIGSFRSSSPLFNQTHDLVDWAMRSNMSFVLTDCPHREKLGWLECAHLLFPSFAYRYDVQSWFHKICRDMRDIQLLDGRVTTVAPSYLQLPVESAFKFTIEWGAACVLAPWEAYRWYGDLKFLSENYGMMKSFVEWIDKHSENGLAPGGLGDWYDYGHGQGPGPSRYTPTNLTATAMWAMCAKAAAGAARAVGKSDDAAKFDQMHARIKIAFLKEFYDPATKTLRNNGSVQTGHAMALCADLIPEFDRPAVLQAIVDELARRDYQQTPGDIGHLYFIRALAEAGRSDVLHRVYSRTGVGSYGGILAKGLTAMPETWDAITVGSNSLNHCMLGHVMEWFYGWVVGIRQARGSVGWKSLTIAPEPGALTSASGKTSTPLGEVSVSWKQAAGVLTMDVVVPLGATAELVLPFESASAELDGKPVATVQGALARQSVRVSGGRHRLKASLRKSGEKLVSQKNTESARRR